MTYSSGSFNTDYVAPPKLPTCGIRTPCPQSAVSSGVAKLGGAFDGAGVVLLFIPGMQVFAGGCAIIGVSLFLIGTYVMKD